MCDSLLRDSYSWTGVTVLASAVKERAGLSGRELVLLVFHSSGRQRNKARPLGCIGGSSYLTCHRIGVVS